MKDTLKYDLETDFDLEFNDLIVTEESNDISSTLKNSVTGRTVTKAGIDKQKLQDAIDAYAIELNKAAIARSTGMPVKTPSTQYKGFAAEEFFKHTLKINALAKGKELQAFTKGPLPDGSTLSGTDMTTDISIWYKKYPLSKPKKLADYQSKIHNNSSDYAKDISNKQYKNVNFVGGANQGVNDKVRVNIGKREYSSDSITPEEATKLADAMKSQNSPVYDKASEKHAELDKVNLGKAVKTGAVSGLIISFTKEIISVFKNRNNLNKEQFINAIINIIYGTTDGGIRSGSIMGSVQLLSKIAGKEITSNSLGAIPAMSIANVGVDLAKDLYLCFVSQDISSILRLASLSGCEIKFPTDNINDILETIQKEISNLNQDDWVRKTTLLRLKRVVQEHMESQKMIQYIDWVIQQKKLSSKKLASKRKQSNNELNLLEKQIFEAKQERKKNREQMEKLAHSVRCFWVKPLLDLDVKISNVRKKKAEIYTEKDKLNIDIDETKTKKRQISKEIEDIKKSRSSNSSWDDLWKEKNKLSKRLDDLYESKKQKSQELSQLYEDQNKYKIKKDEWLEKRRVLLSLLKNNKVNSKLLKQSVKADEKEIAKKEIEKINQKKVDFEHRESERVKREKETLRINFKNDLENLELKIQSAIGKRLVAESEVKESRNKVDLEERKDTRLIKVFFDSPKVKEAKKALSKSEELLSKRNNILEELQKKEKELKSKYNKEQSTIRPKSYNMSAKDRNNLDGYQLLLKNLK